jgi:DNA sulfur modification protein DndD
VRLRSVQIQNFKLLRQIEVDFSIDWERPLTVIRAENASGKTSMLNALKWALYGVDGLDDPNVRLAPSYWPNGTPCPISVELDFDRTLFNQMGSEWRPVEERFRLVRTVNELLDGDDFRRDPDALGLYRLTDSGWVQVSPPEPVIAEMLPIEMKDIFFTNGDAAMNFVSPQLTKATKRDQVKDAIKSLLGMGLIEKATDHVEAVQTKLTKQIAAASANAESTEVAQQLESARAELTTALEEKGKLGKQVESLTEQLDKAERAIDQALQLGAYDEIVLRRQKAKEQLGAADKIDKGLKADHRRLLESESLSWSLIDETLRQAYGTLDGMRLKGIIPRAAVAVLNDRLDLERCICGESLAPGTAARQEVEVLITQQKAVEEDKQTLTRLLHAARASVEERDAGALDWMPGYEALAGNRLNVRKLVEEADQELRYCDEQLKKIDQADVTAKRQQRDALKVALQEKEAQRRDVELRELSLIERVKALDDRFNQITKAESKLSALRAQRAATSDILTVLSGSLEELNSVYLRKVSDRMSELFLELVGADPDEASVFQGASITDSYEIVVHTVQGRTLNPDFEVNGASQRALTFAFIWALTEVSGVVAPRIIDTPLGMMAGAVKQRTVEMISRPRPVNADPTVRPEPDRQVVLFLTRSEIAQVEHVIDDRAGAVVTFSNTDHFPTDLTNDPGTDRPEILTCACDHRHVCRVCQRSMDGAYNLTMRT